MYVYDVGSYDGPRGSECTRRAHRRRHTGGGEETQRKCGVRASVRFIRPSTQSSVASPCEGPSEMRSTTLRHHHTIISNPPLRGLPMDTVRGQQQHELQHQSAASYTGRRSDAVFPFLEAVLDQKKRMQAKLSHRNKVEVEASWCRAESASRGETAMHTRHAECARIISGFPACFCNLAPCTGYHRACTRHLLLGSRLARCNPFRRFVHQQEDRVVVPGGRDAKTGVIWQNREPVIASAIDAT